MLKDKLLKLAVTASLAAPALAFAESTPGSPDGPNQLLPEGSNNASDALLKIVNNIIDWFFYIVLIVAVIFLVYAGFIFVMSAGDEGKTTQAKNMIVYAVIGITVAILAKTFVFLAGDLVGVNLNLN